MRSAVLVIDDDMPTREFISELLTDEGFAVRAVNNALAAIVALADDLPSLILCDYHMPGIDGLTFTQQVRSIGIDVPIVLMTADVRAPSARGMEHISFCLLKPFEISDLLDCVETHTRR
jgi:CheY-like chemotaxis protein